jgi:hypothetical protein
MFNVAQNKPFQEKAAMHLKHVFMNSNFKQVVAAFLLKYNCKNSFCTITICHVEQLNEN